MPDQSDIYHTIAAPAEGFIKDKGSKFHAYAYPVLNAAQIEEAQAALRKIHSKARHHCYAYRLGTDGNNFRANDDGEPSGTAGKPILGQIDSFGITDVLIVVVRYFGGTLLGTGGLISAYRTAASEALKEASILEKTLKNVFQLHFDYSLMAPVMNAVKKQGIEIVEQSFNDTAFISVAIPISESEAILMRIKASILGVSLEQVDPDTKIGGLVIKQT